MRNLEPKQLNKCIAGEPRKRSILSLLKAEIVRGFMVIPATPQHSSTAVPEFLASNLKRSHVPYGAERSDPPTSSQGGPNKPNKPNEPHHLFNALLYALCSMLLLVPSIVRADFGDLFTYFEPYLSVQEEYNSNINLTPTNEVDDFITTISPGFRFSTLPRTPAAGERQAPTAEQSFGVDLDLRAGFVFYAEEDDNDYTSANGLVNAWYLFGNKLAFRIRDYFIRSDELREGEYSATAIEGQYLLSTQRRRVIYIRNVAEPSIEYKFGKDDRISLYYRNNIYEVDSRVYEDSQENYINPRLTYWFNIRHGITLEYGLTLGDFERSPDLTGHMGTGRYTYRFNPRTSIFGEYTYLFRDFDPPSIDYDIQRPSLGIEHAFSPTLTAKGQGGYFWQNPERGSKTKGPFFDVSLTQRAEKTTYTLLLQGGYTEDYFTAENLGFTRYYRGVGAVTHRLLERMTAGLSGYVEWVEYPSDPADREDLIWGIRGSLSYQLFKWLTASLEGSYREDHSNIDVNDYDEYRGIFRITASF